MKAVVQLNNQSRGHQHARIIQEVLGSEKEMYAPAFLLHRPLQPKNRKAATASTFQHPISIVCLNPADGTAHAVTLSLQPEHGPVGVKSTTEVEDVKLKEFMVQLEEESKGSSNLRVRYRPAAVKQYMGAWLKRAQQAHVWAVKAIRNVGQMKDWTEGEKRWLFPLLCLAHMLLKPAYRVRWWQFVLGVIGDGLLSVGLQKEGKKLALRNLAAREVHQLWLSSRAGQVQMGIAIFRLF